MKLFRWGLSLQLQVWLYPDFPRKARQQIQLVVMGHMRIPGRANTGYGADLSLNGTSQDQQVLETAVTREE